MGGLFSFRIYLFLLSVPLLSFRRIYIYISHLADAFIKEAVLSVRLNNQRQHTIKIGVATKKVILVHNQKNWKVQSSYRNQKYKGLGFFCMSGSATDTVYIT